MTTTGRRRTIRPRKRHGERLRPLHVAGDPAWPSIVRDNLLMELERQAPEIWPELRAVADPLLAAGDAAGARSAIERWVEKRRLGAPWIVDYAIERLEREPTDAQLRAHPELARYRSNFGWRPIEWAPSLRPPSPPVPLEWNPTREPLAMFEQRVRQHVAACHAWALERGAKPAPRTTDRALRRLARRMLGDSPEKIAAQELPGRSAGTERGARALKTRAEDIRDIVKDLAEMLGVTLAPATRGRSRS